jgi:hypothetical protein
MMGKYIFTTICIPIDYYWGCRDLMAAQDIKKVIDTLRDTAVGNCRERLEQAALRSKGLINDGQTYEKKEKTSLHSHQYGMTSLLKRKHGL